MNTKIDNIESFLKGIFPISEIVYAMFDLNHNFRVTTDNEIYLLRLGYEFVSNNESDYLVQKLIDWEVSKELIAHGEMGVLVTSGGISLFARS